MWLAASKLGVPHWQLKRTEQLAGNRHPASKEMVVDKLVLPRQGFHVWVIVFLIVLDVARVALQDDGAADGGGRDDIIVRAPPQRCPAQNPHVSWFQLLSSLLVPAHQRTWHPWMRLLTADAEEELSLGKPLLVTLATGPGTNIESL